MSTYGHKNLHVHIMYAKSFSLSRICPEDLPTRELTWKKLSHIIDCYDRLYWDDLTFLLEVRSLLDLI